MSLPLTMLQSPELPFGGLYKGIEGAADLLGKKLPVYLNSYIEFERVIDAGYRIAVIGRTHGNVVRTGAKMDLPVMHLWEFKEGLAVRLEIVVDLPAMTELLHT